MRRQIGAVFIALVVFGASIRAVVWAQSSEDWVTIFDGSNLDSFLLTGDANWHIAGDIVEATDGQGSTRVG